MFWRQINIFIIIIINNLISNSQFGFRSSHSTIHPMIKFMNFVSEALNKKQHTIAIFCDLRKAFDTCNHPVLFKTMEKLVIKGITLDWLKTTYRIANNLLMLMVFQAIYLIQQLVSHKGQYLVLSYF